MMGEFWAACDRLRALLPATEPAGERCQKWTVRVAGGIETGIRCVLPAGHECFHDYVPPAPAEPAEEETKAEASAIEAGMGLVDWDLIPERGDPNEAAYVAARGAVKAYAANRFEAGFQDLSALIERLVADARSSGHYNDPSKLAGYAEGIEHAYLALAASSPVVPAPTETEWQTWQEVPEGVQYYGINGWGPTYYVNRGGVRYRVFDGTPSKTADYVVQNFAPFVAAEEG